MAKYRSNVQNLKDFIDAEGLMPLSTTDFHMPICMEMKTLSTLQAAGFYHIYHGTAEDLEEIMSPVTVQKSGQGSLNVRQQLSGQLGNFFNTHPGQVFTTADLAASNINNNIRDNDIQNNLNNNNDMGSMDSSDTFATCNTHPFLSQADLTSDVVDPICALDGSNLYVNPMVDKETAGRPSGVKKSASGDTALRNISTTDEERYMREYESLDRGSRVSLNDPQYPKQRRTRFQQSGGKLRMRFGDTFERDSQESLEKKPSKRSLFMPTRGLASATRIINQHLFGIQSLGGSKSKNSGSKSSLSQDSIDSRTTSPKMERSSKSKTSVERTKSISGGKSILKKADAASATPYHRSLSSGQASGTDPESERLIDSISGGPSGQEYGSGSEYSPAHKGRHSSPPALVAKHKKLSQTRSAGYQQAKSTSIASQAIRSPLFLLDDILPSTTTGAHHHQQQQQQHQVPLYICPPPPPMDEVLRQQQVGPRQQTPRRTSPIAAEQTRLLVQQQSTSSNGGGSSLGGSAAAGVGAVRPRPSSGGSRGDSGR